MQNELKEALASRLDKYLSRETIAMVIGLLGLLETNAGPELWAIFAAVSITILRGAKAFEKYVEYKHGPKATTKTAEVASIKDTQDTPTEKPEF